MNQRTHRVEIGIAVGNHDPLGSRRRAAYVIDGEEVAFGDVRPRDVGWLCRERRLVIQPALALPGQRDEMLDPWDLVPNAVDGFQVLVARADDRRARVLDA